MRTMMLYYADDIIPEIGVTGDKDFNRESFRELCVGLEKTLFGDEQ